MSWYFRRKSHSFFYYVHYISIRIFKQVFFTPAHKGRGVKLPDYKAGTNVIVRGVGVAAAGVAVAARMAKPHRRSYVFKPIIRATIISSRLAVRE